MKNRKDWLVNYNSKEAKKEATTNNKIYNKGNGDVVVILQHSSPIKSIKGLVYVPEISQFLLSFRKMIDKELVVILSGIWTNNSNCIWKQQHVCKLEFTGIRSTSNKKY